MATIDALTAFSRLGLGPRPGDLAAVGTDARDALLAELATPEAARLEGAPLLDSAAALGAYRAFRLARKAARDDLAATPEMHRDAPGEGNAASDAMDADAATPAPEPDRRGRKPGRQAKKAAGRDRPTNYNLRTELPARLERLASVQLGFVERLVMFWANHFAIEADNGGVMQALAGPFEREAIRPHVLGSFRELLFAATQHPAMLVYLNNATSVGPNSPAGQRREAGLNENHARELMELHTLGVAGGYTQADVTSLARILTGWSVNRNENAAAASYGRFQFRRQAHEPGTQQLLGASFADGGRKQGEAALDLLASHPATARHIADKLARHFVADIPPAPLVDRLAATFTETGGDLLAVSTALVEADETWTAPALKLRTPQEFVWASIRALGVRPRPQELIAALTTLGQPLFNPPSPAGYRDDLATWLAPDAMTNRLDIAELLALAADTADPRALAEDILGPRLSPLTAQTIARAESPVQGLALLLMSPEFQRR